MQKVLHIQGDLRGTICLDYLPCINYAMILNGSRTFTKFELRNDDAEDWEDVEIRLTGDMLETCSMRAPHVAAGGVVNFVEANLMPTTSKLMALTEAVQTEYTVHVLVKGVEVTAQALAITIMAFDQWHGTGILPEQIVSFVTPNNPCLSPILLKAADNLEMLSGNKDLNGYMSGSYQRVTQQIEAVYNALLEEHLVYAINPASFEPFGQRIRLVDKVLKEKMGNCLDITLLLCSCLESIGLKTIMTFFNGHTAMGVWLDPANVVPMIGMDVNVLINGTEGAERNMVLIESTSLTKGVQLDEAVRHAEEFVRDANCGFEFFVDVFAARQNKVRPLPQNTLTDKGWKITDTNEYEELFERLTEHDPYDIHGTASEKKLHSKQLLWERKLLDLSLRNNLLNMKAGKRIVALPEMSIDSVLESLEKEAIASYIEEKDNYATAKELYRAARNSIEENGANTLFLSVGSIRWYEVGGQRAFYAPILFIPIEMVRHNAKKYIIRARDEEPIMNITLMEMMRQTFEMKIPDISPIPMTEEGRLDWKKVFGLMQVCIDGINASNGGDSKWEITEECMVGVFSFTKFVMWNDIHSHADILAKHKLLRSMVEGHITWSTDDSQNIDARQLDATAKPMEYALPVDVDSSQLEAVVDSGRGNTFILYGPPGTGKSQTITNMIANALYQGKRVLFVAEKKAALDVVQNRLGKIGLDPFCLELHSNKVDKKSVLNQLETALNAGAETKKARGFESRSTELFTKRQELNAYIEALHKKRESGLSLYECINRYLAIEGNAIALQYNDIKHLDLNKADDLADEYGQMDIVIDILHQHPNTHPLLQLLPRENTAENQRNLTEAIALLQDDIEVARKKERSIWNRWFMKRTANEILHRRDSWKRFMALTDVEEPLKEDIDTLKKALGLWNVNTDFLREWYHYSTRVLKIADYDVKKVRQYFLQGQSGKATADAFRKGFYYRIAMHIIENDESLRAFNGMLFDDVIVKYNKLTRQFQELTKQELCYRLASNIPTETDDKTIGEELTILKKRIASHGRAMSVRRIIDQAQHILPRLTPCMLMSPLSVAQYLPMTEGLFDLVIFDEASQMPTSEAVGAIARGKAVVVVGDPKQMPPTSFFATNNTNEDDIEIDDLDSILDDCISLSVPSRYLNWHYRSKHESLIAFSNINYYDGRLITFPSVDDQDRKVSLEYIDGTYDFGKTRQNKAEAKAIVEDVLSRLEAQNDGKVSARSIGIVAFSKVQSNLIEDMLLDALSKKKELEAFAFGGNEPLFVKNLENVQGDERDVILFSVGYGPDKSGKVSMNFGPLNQAGGERRLNVAVSRARYEMRIFSSLHPEQIDLQRTNAEGVAAMKRFLEYAEGGSIARPNTQITASDVSAITQQIATVLKKRGYDVHLGIGRSKFKIDLAIVDKDNPNKYKLGIILDGPSYAKTPTARDREIVQPSILSILGWQIKHIWTTEWIENPANCIERIVGLNG